MWNPWKKKQHLDSDTKDQAADSVRAEKDETSGADGDAKVDKTPWEVRCAVSKFMSRKHLWSVSSDSSSGYVCYLIKDKEAGLEVAVGNLYGSYIISPRWIPESYAKEIYDIASRKMLDQGGSNEAFSWVSAYDKISQSRGGIGADQFSRSPDVDGSPSGVTLETSEAYDAVAVLKDGETVALFHTEKCCLSPILAACSPDGDVSAYSKVDQQWAVVGRIDVSGEGDS